MDQSFDFEQGKQEFQKHSSCCLKILDQAYRELQRSDQATQFNALIQIDRVRQEFISFHQLLIEEESKILQHLEKTLEDYSLRTRDSVIKYGILVDEEASLMCQSSRYIDKDSVVVDTLILEKWEKARSAAIDLLNSIQPMPSVFSSTFSLFQQKTEIAEHLKSVLDPFQLFTVSSTMFLEDDFMTAPFKVSDLFLYKNSRRSSSEIVLDIEIICDKNILLKAVLNMTDYIFNYPGGCCLDECKRYLVKATHVTRNKDKFTRTDKRMERYKHILIVTGNVCATENEKSMLHAEMKTATENERGKLDEERKTVIDTEIKMEKVKLNVGMKIDLKQEIATEKFNQDAKMKTSFKQAIENETFTHNREINVYLEQMMEKKTAILNAEMQITLEQEIVKEKVKLDAEMKTALKQEIEMEKVKLAAEMKTTLEKEIDRQRECYVNKQLSSLIEENDKKQSHIDQLKQDNQKLSLHVGHREVTQLEQDTYSKFVAEDSESSTGKRSYPQIPDEELKEQNVARLEESVCNELQKLNNVKKLFVLDIQKRWEKTQMNKKDGEDDNNLEGSLAQQKKISFLENNLDQLTKVHKQLLRDNADLRINLSRMERRLKATCERVIALESALKEAREGNRKDRKSCQDMLATLESAVRQWHSTRGGRDKDCGKDYSCIFCEQTTLFIYRGDKWDEAGKGKVKLLYNAETSFIMLNIQMERIKFIHYNFLINNKATLGQEKTTINAPFGNAWILSAVDISKGNIVLEKVSLLFTESTTSENFKRTFDKLQIQSQIPSFSGTGNNSSWLCTDCLLWNRNDEDMCFCTFCGSQAKDELQGNI